MATHVLCGLGFQCCLGDPSGLGECPFCRVPTEFFPGIPQRDGPPLGESYPLLLLSCAHYCCHPICVEPQKGKAPFLISL